MRLIAFGLGGSATGDIKAKAERLVAPLVQTRDGVGSHGEPNRQ